MIMKKTILNFNVTKHLLSILLALITLFALSLLIAKTDYINQVYAADADQISVGDHIYYGKKDASGYTGLPYWRVLDKGSDGSLLLMSEYLWKGDGKDPNNFVKFNNAENISTDAEKAPIWKTSNAKAWCVAFEKAVLNDTNDLTILETTKSDDQFTSPDLEQIVFEATANILDGDKVFFLSAEEIIHYYPNKIDRVGYVYNPSGVTEDDRESYWLRSPRLYNPSHCAGKVVGLGDDRGAVDRSYTYNPLALRPALWVKIPTTTALYKSKTGDWLIGDAAIEEQAKDAAEAENARKAAEAEEIRRNGLQDYNLPKVSIKTPVKAKKSFTAKWKKLSKKNQKKVQGIELQYAANNTFTQSAVVKRVGKTKKSLKVKKLQAKGTYWVRARTYKTIGGIKHVSAWSKAKKVRVK